MGVHGEKLTAALTNDKLPPGDIPRVEATIEKYSTWVQEMEGMTSDTLPKLVRELVQSLNEYKLHVDLFIFDSPNDFLYTQKEQMEIDNSVVEEFLPVLVRKCLDLAGKGDGIDIALQTPMFSSVYFKSNLACPDIGGGFEISMKDQDFALSRKMYLQASSTKGFDADKTVTRATNIGYILAEIKTNLNKTMFLEALAKARDFKFVVTGAKYFLLCDFLDMPPVSSAMTDIDEVLILRKARRLNSSVRTNYATYNGRLSTRHDYVTFLQENPYAPEVFLRFVEHILAQFNNETLAEDDFLCRGYL